LSLIFLFKDLTTLTESEIDSLKLTLGQKKRLQRLITPPDLTGSQTVPTARSMHPAMYLHAKGRKVHDGALSVDSSDLLS
jgi:hypothetical protein